MIVARFILVAVVIVVASLGLAWLFTGQRKYLGYLNRVLRFALITGLVTAMLFVVERVVLR